MKVDIKKILTSKSPTLAKVPFLVPYLRGIVHEDKVNYFIEKYSHLGAIDFIRHSLDEMGIGYKAEGLDGLDKKGRYIFASNHPFGGLDGVMLAEKVSDYFGDVKVVVNDLLMNLEPIKSIFIPINKHGRQSAQYSNLYNDAFSSDVPIITFPAGLVSRRKKGVVADLGWKPNFVKQAIATQRDIVPVYFEGSLSDFFYRLSNFRKSIGIKANIEMLYLVDEMFKQRGAYFDIIIGEPVSWQSLEDRKPRQAALDIRTKAYNLKKT